MRNRWYFSFPEHNRRSEQSADGESLVGFDLDDLVKAAQGKHPAAVEHLFIRFHPLTKRLIKRYRHLAMVEDLPGEIYLEFVRLTKQYDPSRGIPFASYMRRMLESQIHTIVRRDCRFRIREVSLTVWDSHSQVESSREDGNPRSSDTLIPATRNDEILDSVLTKDLVRRVEAILSPRQAEVFIRHALHEEDYAKIAAVLDSTPAAARFLYHCARRTLQKRLQHVREQ